MKSNATKEEEEVIDEMCNAILRITRENRNYGHTAMIALIIDNYHQIGTNQEKFLEDMELFWNFYEMERRKSVPSHLNKRKQVEDLFDGAKRSEKKCH